MHDIQKEELTGLLSLEIDNGDHDDEDDDDKFCDAAENDSSSSASASPFECNHRQRSSPQHSCLKSPSNKLIMVGASVILIGWVIGSGRSPSADEESFYQSSKPSRINESAKKCINARGKPCYANSYRYERRGKELTLEEEEILSKEWGSWELRHRPIESGFFEEFLNRDVPEDAWTAIAQPWQRDSKYMKEFLTESISLVERAQLAIRTEYGDEKTEMFDVAVLDEWPVQKDKKESLEDSKGGWTMQRSWQGLKRRLFHAIMTQDSFVFSMAGHRYVFRVKGNQVESI